MSNLREWDDEDTSENTPSRDADAPRLYHGSVDEFVREFLIKVYRHKVGLRGHRRWAAE